jgi:adenylate cyclase class IV
MAAPARNLELKALDPDPERTLTACRELGAVDEGERVQRDTYFFAVQGRLKLRESPPAPAELIAYARADREGPTVSLYRVVPVADHVALAAGLGDALGVRAVVDKRRRVLRWRHVRIHLDQVRGLGPFVELEAVAASSGGLEAERVTLEDLRRALGLEHAPLVARGYADLIERASRFGPVG